MLPSPNAEPDRYRGRPLLIVLENYVLAAIGVLPKEADQRLAQLVKSVFGGDDDWKKTVRQQLELSDEIDDSFRELWNRNQAIAKQNGIELHPVQFAKEVVDTNFADLIGPAPKQ